MQTLQKHTYVYIYIKDILSLPVCPSKKEWLNNTAPDSVMHSPKKNICVKQHHHSGRQSFSKIICYFPRWTFLVCMRPTSILPAWSPPQMGRAHGSWGWFKSREAAVNRCGDEAAVDIQPGNHWKSRLGWSEHLPFGKRLHDDGKIHHFEREHPL